MHRKFFMHSRNERALPGHPVPGQRPVALRRVRAMAGEPRFLYHLTARGNPRINAAAREHAAPGRISVPPYRACPDPVVPQGSGRGSGRQALPSGRRYWRLPRTAIRRAGP